MATNAHTASGRGESSGGRTGRSLGKTVASAVNTDTLIDLVQRLGLIDMVIDKMRARIEEADIDEFLDDAGKYIRKNPEAVVVGLGAATLAAGVLVFLHSREQARGHEMRMREDREEPIFAERETRESRETRETPSRGRASATPPSPAPRRRS